MATGEATFDNEITFTGSVTDTSTGLQYMNSRYYEPTTGRFLSQDTYSGNAYEPWTQHLYSYCGNNPTNFVDPTGHMRVEGMGRIGDWHSMNPFVPKPTPEETENNGNGGGASGNGGGSSGDSSVESVIMAFDPILGPYDPLANFIKTDDLSEGTMAGAEITRCFTFGMTGVIGGTAVVYDKEKYAIYTFGGATLGPSIIIPYVKAYTFGTVKNVTDASDYSGNFWEGLAGMTKYVNGTAYGDDISVEYTIEGGVMPGMGISGGRSTYTLLTLGWVYGDFRETELYDEFLTRDHYYDYRISPLSNSM